jgi:hypothetical protein
MPGHECVIQFADFENGYCTLFRRDEKNFTAASMNDLGLAVSLLLTEDAGNLIGKQFEKKIGRDCC